MREWCDQAGLYHCWAHGRRKAGAAGAAQKGATEHQLMATFRWKAIQEAERYKRAARRKHLAAAGSAFLARGGIEESAVPFLLCIWPGW